VEYVLGLDPGIDRLTRRAALRLPLAGRLSDKAGRVGRFIAMPHDIAAVPTLSERALLVSTLQAGKEHVALR